MMRSTGLVAMVVIGSVVAGPVLPAPAAHTPPLRILVSNDDGVKAPGLDQLVNGLRALGNVQVIVVAPLRNRSGSGDRTTPGRLTAIRTTTRSGHPAWAVRGYPADAIRYALGHVVGARKVDLVIAGINQGANLGPFVTLSGTIGAARAAARRGLPALATSEGTPSITHFGAAVRITIAWVKTHRHDLRPGIVHNLNTPQCSAGRVRGTVTVATNPALLSALATLRPIDCTQSAGPAGNDVDAYRQGFATVSTLPRGQGAG